MDKYVIIKLGAFQHTVEEGKEYTVERIVAKEGEKMEINEVLAVANGDKLTVGKPFVEGAKVTLTILEQGKGEKVTQRLFKAKSRYHKARGHRKLTTKFKVDKIIG